MIDCRFSAEASIVRDDFALQVGLLHIYNLVFRDGFSKTLLGFTGAKVGKTAFLEDVDL